MSAGWHKLGWTFSPPYAIIFYKKEDNMLFNLGMPELLVILLIVLLIFGASRLPEIANSIGRAIQEFKKAIKEGKSKKE